MNRRDYIASLYSLARSIVIHSPITAAKINEHLQYEKNQAIDPNPRTWKYYLNLSGEYHRTDEEMRVVSQDTSEIIPFTRGELDYHRITRLTYASKQKEYRRLCKRYPHQKMLIDRILRPIDMETAIAAEEGDILDADAHYYESQEVTLFIELREWIRSYLMRRNVRSYMDKEEYFPAARLAPLYANLPLEIDNIRLSLTQTHETHSYYVRAHLESHGGLGRYLDDLSWDQALWLYRNIRKIQSNLGKQSNFDYLINNLLIDKDLSIHRLALAKDTQNILDDLKSPSYFIHQSLIDSNDDVYPDRETAREHAQSHYTQRPYLLGQAMDRASHNAYVTTWTRHLISRLEEGSLEGQETLFEYTLRHWIAYAMNKRIHDDIIIRAPKQPRHTLYTQEQAVLIYLYCVGRMNGHRVREFGDVVLTDIHRGERPTLSDIRLLTSADRISEEAIDVFTRGSSNLPVRMDRKSFARFTSLSYLQKTKQTFFLSNIDDAIVRGQLQAVRDAYYIDANILEGSQVEVSYTTTDDREWIIDIDVSEYTTDDFRTLATIILEKCLHVDPNDRLIDMSRTHRAAINIIERLTSYQSVCLLDRDPKYQVSSVGIAPRLMNLTMIDLTQTIEPQPIAATIAETHTGIVDDRYVTPYTLEDRLSHMEYEYIEYIDEIIQTTAQVFETNTRRL